MRENGWVPVRAQGQSIRTEARRGFQKHVVRFARVEHLQTWEKNQVRPEVVLVNSHDTSSAGQHSLKGVTARTGKIVRLGLARIIQRKEKRS